ncbi:hypothetical protein [Dactylosporangium sp. CS-033363]|uniref:hypothetical protein n=1 Tax=Dactylosporangium sp. CS-033363 TaxID=3239935 RepID=UPI003D90E227
MTVAAVVALLVPVQWAPPGSDLAAWRAAMAEDLVDLLTPLPRVQPAIAAVAADLPLAAKIAWPSTRIYEVPAPTIRAALTAAFEDGQDKAAVVLADAPDLPAMLIGKLLRPLSTRALAVAPAHNGGLLGAAANLPLPEWVPELDALHGDVAAARRPAPEPTMVASAPGWHRLRGPDDLRRLDPGLDGWEATRAMLS